jgi:diguanylate cyclase (GGDEF)-like protein
VEVADRTAELRRAVAELERLALRDGLTGLFNHRYFQESIDAEISRAARHKHSVGLLFIDVDSFKNYNDQVGHPAGDRLLKTLGDLLSGRGDSYGRSKRVSDTAARYGGEEFVLVLPETDKNGTVITAERVRRTIANYEFDQREVQPRGYVSVSIGVACFPEDGGTKGELIEAADRALYRAKHLGRDRVCVAGYGDGVYEVKLSDRPPPPK